MINRSCKNGLIKFRAKGKGSINRKQNRNLMALMWCIGVKYGYIIVQEKKPEIPLKLTHNVKKIREEICYKAWRDFKVPISFKQINCLLYLKGDRMPFTAIIILMTIYNLLKENGGIDKNVKNALRKYLAETCTEATKYEKFVCRDYLQLLCERRNHFMNTKYREIYSILMHTREKTYDVFQNLIMLELVKNNFQSRLFTKEDIPDSCYQYCGERRYVKTSWNI